MSTYFSFLLANILGTSKFWKAGTQGPCQYKGRLSRYGHKDRTVVWPSYLIMVIILLVRRHLMGSRIGPNARRCHIVPVAGLWNTIDYVCRLCDWNKIYRILSHLTTAWSSHGISNDKKRGIYWRIMTLTKMSLMYKSYPVLRLS